MSNLNRSLAPVSAAAWAAIEDEAKRTFTESIAGRRVVDMPAPAGDTFSALGTGHLEAPFPSPAVAGGGAKRVSVRRRTALPVVELRVPFTVTRAAVDDVSRGAADSDWQPVKDAATAMAHAEDGIVLRGLADAGLTGIGPASSNAPVPLPADVVDFPDALARALTTLRLVGVHGPYSLLLSADLYRELAETSDHGYPVLKHVTRVLSDDSRIVWAPALEGALLVSERGGDYELHLGQDLAIGYLAHDAEHVQLYLQETLTFRVNTAEAAVALTPNA